MITFPKDKTKLAAVMKRILDEGVRVLNIQRVRWLVTSLYMQGVRDFRQLDYQMGRVTYGYENVRGQIDYTYEQITRRHADEYGRRIKFDATPVVEKGKDFSLDGLRRDSMGQATLNTLIADLDLEKIKSEAINLQLSYGKGGLFAWGKTNKQEDRSKAYIEVVPPWQLIPVPVNPAIPGEVYGIIRHRKVPLEWLKTREGLKPPKGDWKALKITKAQVGQSVENLRLTEGVDNTSNQSVTGEQTVVTETEVPYVEMSEYFGENPDGSLNQWIVYAGGVILRDERWDEDDQDEETGDAPMMPLATFDDIPTGGFYARSFDELLMPTNVEVEHLLRSLFENFADMDAFGFLMIPTTEGVNVQDFKKTGKPRVIMYEPDLTVPEHKPYAISPTNMRDAPGKVAAFGRSIIDDMAGQSEMLRGDAPGRVDSAQGLGFLWEASNIPLGGPMHSLAQAFIKVYRALLGMARAKWGPATLARLTTIDDALVGVVLDPATGKIKLDMNSVPNPLTITIKVKSQLPRSGEQRKAELLQLLQQQVITLRQFKRTAQLEGLDFPIPTDAEFQSYRKAMFNNIIMFNDGKTPGQVVVSIEADLPEVHLEALQNFMARPEFTLASAEVRKAFEEMKRVFSDQSGQRLPPGVGHPEEEAESALSPAGGPELPGGQGEFG